MTFGRRLGVDFGQARIGIAICDADGMVSTPLVTLKNDKKLLSELAKIVNEYQPIGIYLGKPIHLSGVEGATVENVAKFAEELKNSFDLPITYVDERLTSGQAAKSLKTAGKSARESREFIDQLAAVSILELGIQIEKRN
jgi:putative Holliday junction resolvase